MNANMQYTAIACGSRFSVIGVTTYSGRGETNSDTNQKIEELWILGDQSQSNGAIKQVMLPRSGLKDLKCSNDHILILMHDGQAFALDRNKQFEMRPLTFFPQKIVEIAASEKVFAALDFKNVIYRWQADQSMLD
jgi:hypothetical protein